MEQMYQTSRNGNPYVRVSRMKLVDGRVRRFWAVIVRETETSITFQRILKDGSVPSNDKEGDLLDYFVAAKDSDDMVYKPAHMSLMYGWLEVI